MDISGGTCSSPVPCIQRKTFVQRPILLPRFVASWKPCPCRLKDPGGKRERKEEKRKAYGAVKGVRDMFEMRKNMKKHWLGE